MPFWNPFKKRAPMMVHKHVNTMPLMMQPFTIDSHMMPHNSTKWDYWFMDVTVHFLETRDTEKKLFAARNLRWEDLDCYDKILETEIRAMDRENNMLGGSGMTKDNQYDYFKIAAPLALTAVKEMRLTHFNQAIADHLDNHTDQFITSKDEKIKPRLVYSLNCSDLVDFKLKTFGDAVILAEQFNDYRKKLRVHDNDELFSNSDALHDTYNHTGYRRTLRHFCPNSTRLLSMTEWLRRDP